MKSKFVACVLGLLLIAAVGSLEASSVRGYVGLTVTGQKGCWDLDGNSIPCAGTGQDGEYQKGWTTGPNPRFKDNGNGTVADRLTGLTWLKDANCFGHQTRSAALSLANGLAQGSCGLTDGSVAGNWRLPNVTELLSLIDYQNSSPALSTGHPFSGVQLSPGYWSSTACVIGEDYVWYVHFTEGFTSVVQQNINSLYMWPVRGGQ